MDFSLYIILSLIGPIFFLIGLVVIKMIARKEIPDSQYTPFDYITGQTTVQFHEEQQEQEEVDEHGDDNDKRKKFSIEFG